MKFLLLKRLSLLCAILLMASPPILQGQEPPLVQAVRVEHVGPAAVNDAFIKSNIRVKPGDPYNPARVDDDVTNLYQTGFFYNIQVEEQVDANQGLTITYRVQGKPVLTDIRFVGNESYKTRKLRKKITSEIGEPLDERKLFADKKALIEAYQKKGMQKTTITYRPAIDEEEGNGIVTFEIQEQPRIRIEDVQFVGAGAFSQRKLRKTIKTRRHWMWSWLTGSGKFKEEQFEEDKEKLTRFYQDEGYIDFEIEEIVQDMISEDEMILRVLVFEGTQYKVGTISVEGNELFDDDEILTDLPMQVGDTFTPQGLDDNRKAVRDQYESKGYLTLFNEGNTRIGSGLDANTENGTMDLHFAVEEGDQSEIEKIEIKGNSKTKDRVIRRELAVTPGEVFDMTRVEISKYRLEGLNYFSKVETTVEPTEIPNKKNLVIGVEEQSTGNFQIGAGFSSIDSVVGFAEMTQGNFDLFNPPFFTGGGQKLRLRMQYGTRRQDYILTFIEPYFLDRRLELQTELYHREFNFLSSDFDEIRTGASVGFRKLLPIRVRGDVEAGISYTLENVKIANVDANASTAIKQEEGARLVSKIGTTLAYDTRGPGFLPEKGQRTALFSEVAGGPFGADTDFYKLELRSAWYFKGFDEGHIIEFGGQLGVVDAYGDTPRVPLFDRWFLGGMRNVRGFDFREVGPKDSNLEPIGGNTYWFSTVEYSIPIIERLRIAAFYDVGMVYADSYSFDSRGQPKYNDNAGIGIRLNIPNLGPLRLDYAIPIQSDDFNDDGGQFQFGVGFTARQF